MFEKRALSAILEKMIQHTSRNLQAAEKLEILVVVDNYADTMLEPAPGVVRQPMGIDGKLPSDTLLAEHGLCLLLSAEAAGRRARVLLDAGYSPVAAPRNLRQMGVTGGDIDAIVVSHGHEDHVGALEELWAWAGKPPVYLHPKAFAYPRYYKADNGLLYESPRMLEREVLLDKGMDLRENTGPVVIGKELFLLTGEIPRRTNFEHGLPGSLMVEDGREIPDTVPDDQAVVVDLAGHGLAVVSGCAHAGIVNSILYARELTGGKPVYAVAGGFHLSGEPFRPALQPTLQALQREKPTFAAPMHCTGIEAKDLFRRELGPVYAESSVGTRFVLPR